MNVLILAHSLSCGGAERVTVNLANHWAASGREITIVTMAPRSEDFFRLDPRVSRIAFDLASTGGDAVTAVRDNVRRVGAVRRVLREVGPDVALGIMTTANCLLALAAPGTGVATVGSEHIHPPRMPLSRPWAMLRRATYRGLDTVAALTEPSAAWLRAHAGARRTAVIPNPITHPIEDHPPRVEPPGDAVGWVLGVGRLAPQKGFDRLVGAFAAVSADHPGWRLAIVGEGPERDALSRAARSAGLSDRVLLPGAVGNVGDWYRAASLYVMSSRFEGFGNTLAEALAYGVPAVSVDCETGPSEILRHGVDGLLVPQDDPAALIDAMHRLMRDAELRRRMGSAAIEARERFSPARVAAIWDRVFEDAIARRRGH